MLAFVLKGFHSQIWAKGAFINYVVMRGGGGVKKFQIYDYVVYEWPLRVHPLTTHSARWRENQSKMYEEPR